MKSVAQITQINEQLDAILAKVAARTADWCPTFLDGNDINFMTPDERTERHMLLQSVPSFGEEALAAKARIRERIARRKAASVQHKVTVG